MSNCNNAITRRDLLLATVASCLLPAQLSFATESLLEMKPRKIITKSILGTNENLPVVGLGTSRTFDVNSDAKIQSALQQTMQIFFESGGTLIDSSPMYGEAEQVTGRLLKNIKNKAAVFTATKVWTDGRQNGIDQMKQSLKKMAVDHIDLMQIHNLRDWQTHIKTLRDWKERGVIRYIGITTSHGRSHSQLEGILKRESFDFVQLSYNVSDREVEKRLLPLAMDKGISVLVNRPFQRGALFKAVKDQTLPDWAVEIDCGSWAQIFLKFIVSHPSVTCVIPATAKPHHMIDNMAAGTGSLPDAKMRKKIIELVA